jgi:hypothetical protein
MASLFMGAMTDLFTLLKVDPETFLDSMTIVELLRKLGIVVSEENLTRVQAWTEELYKEFLAVQAVCPGMPEILELWVNRPDVTIGLASGNFPAIA